MKQILIIDDDEKLGQLLTQYLERYDMKAHIATTPSKGFDLMVQGVMKEMHMYVRREKYLGFTQTGHSLHISPSLQLMLESYQVI